MSHSSKKETIKLSFDQKERALAVLKSLILSNYFGDHVPDDAALSRMLRIPRSSLLIAINNIIAKNIMTPSSSGQGWDVTKQSTIRDMGTVAFVVNTDPLAGWFSLFRVLASRAETEVQRCVLDSEIPTVILGNSTINEEAIGCICSDNFAGIHKAIDFLISKNHRNISMYVTGLSFHHGFEVRYHAYQYAMRQRHLSPHSELVFPEAHNDLTARRAADVILRMKHKPSAILCASDREAFELVSELRHLNIKVPNDISIMGFDNNHFGK